MVSPDTAIVSATDLSKQSLPAGSWKRAANSWPDNIVRVQYALHVLDKNIMDAARFAASKIDPNTLTALKRWHHNICLETRDFQPDPAELETRANLHSSFAELINKIEGSEEKLSLDSWPQKSLFSALTAFEHRLVKREAAVFTEDNNPILGILVGDYMIKTNNPRDGDFLIRTALHAYEESKNKNLTYQEIFAYFRSKFPKNDFSSLPVVSE